MSFRAVSLQTVKTKILIHWTDSGGASSVLKISFGCGGWKQKEKAVHGQYLRWQFWSHHHKISVLQTFFLTFARLLSSFSLVVAWGVNGFHEPAATSLPAAFPLGPPHVRAGLTPWLDEDSGDSEMLQEVSQLNRWQSSFWCLKAALLLHFPLEVSHKAGRHLGNLCGLWKQSQIEKCVASLLAATLESALEKAWRISNYLLYKRRQLFIALPQEMQAHQELYGSRAAGFDH